MADSMDIDVSVAEATTVTSSASITILRIKRKRDAEQLEALVIDPARRKRVRPSTGLFTYAGTLEEGVDLVAIQQELAALGQGEAKDTHTGPAPAQPALANPNPPPTERLIAPQPSRKYTVVRNKVGDNAVSSQTTSANQLTVYDAVPDDAPLDPADAPEELKNFLPMLESYLQSHAEVNLLDRAPDAGAAGEGDYVYDVYVHRPMQSAATYTNVGSISGLPTAFDDAWDSDENEFPGDTEDEDSNDEDFYRNDYPDERSDDSASEGRGHNRFSDGEGEYIEDPEAYAAGQDLDDEAEGGHHSGMHTFSGRNAVGYW